MYYISESVVRELVRQDDVTNAVSDSFVALARKEAVCFPIVRETLNYANAIFGFKSGFDKAGQTLGVKAGGLWPGNAAKGVPNHQSTILLFDEDSGAPSALVRATYLTALRTAAASALSIRHLAREDAETLGIVGAGGQSEFQLAAALQERDFKKAFIFDPDEENAASLARKAGNAGLFAEVTSPDRLAAKSDVIITVTPSRSPILEADRVMPGTHLACMGADTVGKQEVDPALVGKARIFGDVAEQAVTLGECQHAFKAELITEADITTLGKVIDKQCAGRKTSDEITLFDSTGIALQDFAAGRVALKVAHDAQQIVEMD